MKKSVYSLMLFDEIVERIDQMAYLNNTNRSQLINDILAEHIGLVTPEQKVQAVLDSLEENFENKLSVGQMVKNSSIQFGKSLKYKYRPKVCYSYEFTGSGGQKYAVLKISSRTQSDELNTHFDDFFKMIGQIEREHHITEGQCGQGQTNHKFVREFKKSGEVSQDVGSITQTLTHYLQMIDTAMNCYFSDYESQDITSELEEIYQIFYQNIKRGE
jgi:predicted transcriptional regulator